MSKIADGNGFILFGPAMAKTCFFTGIFIRCKNNEKLNTCQGAPEV
jgi:hypothetical protein